jgi:hypothetical protein
MRGSVDFGIGDVSTTFEDYRPFNELRSTAIKVLAIGKKHYRTIAV